MRVLAIDVGGQRVKALLEGEQLDHARRAPSSHELAPEELVRVVGELVPRDDYARISIALPAPVHAGRVTAEPARLGNGWVGYDFEAAFGRPVRVLNDAAMQALGSYRGGRMLFLRLGSRLDSALIADGALLGLSLGELPFRKERTFEEELGESGLERAGKQAWRTAVVEGARLLQGAVHAEYVVLGGANAKKLGELPHDMHRGDSRLTFVGGFRAWRAAR